MWTVGLVLFALQRYHSAGVAGVSLFLLIFPGLLLSPIAGALLDRHGRKRLMRLDFSVAAVCLTLIVTLAATNHLPGLGSVRPARRWLVDEHAQPRRRALLLPADRAPRPVGSRQRGRQHLLWRVGDSRSGPRRVPHRRVSGVRRHSRALQSRLSSARSRSVASSSRRGSGEVSSRILYEALRGLRYVIANRTLRWIAISMSILNVGWGMVIVALPGDRVPPPRQRRDRRRAAGAQWRGSASPPHCSPAGCAPRGASDRPWRSSARRWGSPRLLLLVPSIAADRRRDRDHRRGRRALQHLDVLAAPAPDRSRMVRTRVCGVDEPQLRGGPDRFRPLRADPRHLDSGLTVVLAAVLMVTGGVLMLLKIPAVEQRA